MLGRWVLLLRLLDSGLRTSHKQSSFNELGTIEMSFELSCNKNIRILFRSIVDLPAHHGVSCGRRHVVSLREPHHPFALEAVQHRNYQFKSLQIPYAHGLIAAAADEKGAIFGSRHAPNQAFVAHVPADLLTLEVEGP